jgi:hypothetical protein
MLKETSLRMTTQRRRTNAKGESKLVKSTYTNSNGRITTFSGVAGSEGRWDYLTIVRHARLKGVDQSLLDFGFMPRRAPSVPFLLRHRVITAKRLRMARAMLKDHRAAWGLDPKCDGALESLERIREALDTIPYQEF